MSDWSALSMKRPAALLVLVFVACTSERPSEPAIQPASPTQTVAELAFTMQPAIAGVGLPMNGAVQVTARTQSGRTAVSFTGAVSIRLGQNPGGAVLIGDSAVFAVGGVATFTNLRVSQAGTGYTFVATALALTATSNAFDIITIAQQSPVGEIAFVRDNQIYLMNADGSGVTPLTTGPDAHSDPAWSPDGTRLAFTNLATGGIYVMNADGSGVVRLTVGGDSPAWSPDGRKIAFSMGLDSTGSVPPGRLIAVMNPDGSGFAWLTSDSPRGHWDESPAWSPDAKRIAFVRELLDDLTPPLIYVMPAEGFVGGAPLTFMPSGTYCAESAPAWKPDGSKMLLLSFCAGGLAIGNSDGSGTLSRIASGVSAPYYFGLGWSPDGTWIVFSSSGIPPLPQTPAIYVMRADGSGAVRLADGIKPAWRPGR